MFLDDLHHRPSMQHRFHRVGWLAIGDIGCLRVGDLVLHDLADHSPHRKGPCHQLFFSWFCISPSSGDEGSKTLFGNHIKTQSKGIPAVLPLSLSPMARRKFSRAQVRRLYVPS
jgi:hypothetical protein